MNPLGHFLKPVLERQEESCFVSIQEKIDEIKEAFIDYIVQFADISDIIARHWKVDAVDAYVIFANLARGLNEE